MPAIEPMRSIPIFFIIFVRVSQTAQIVNVIKRMTEKGSHPTCPTFPLISESYCDAISVAMTTNSNTKWSWGPMPFGYAQGNSNL